MSMRNIRTSAIIIFSPLLIFDIFSSLHSFSNIATGIVTIDVLLSVVFVISLPAIGLVLTPSLFSIGIDVGWRKVVAYFGIALSVIAFMLDCAGLVAALSHYYS